MSDELRDQIASCIGLRRQAAYEAERWFGIGSCADAVMEIVQPLVEQLRQAEVSRDAYRDERDATQRELDEVTKHVDALRVERDKFAAAIAEIVVGLNDDGYTEGTVVDMVRQVRADLVEVRDSRFRWAEEAAEMEDRAGVSGTGTEAANICHCPGSGTLAHVRGCRLHPEADDVR